MVGCWTEVLSGNWARCWHSNSFSRTESPVRKVCLLNLFSVYLGWAQVLPVATETVLQDPTATLEGYTVSHVSNFKFLVTIALPYLDFLGAIKRNWWNELLWYDNITISTCNQYKDCWWDILQPLFIFSAWNSLCGTSQFRLSTCEMLTSHVDCCLLYWIVWS